MTNRRLLASSVILVVCVGVIGFVYERSKVSPESVTPASSAISQSAVEDKDSDGPDLAKVASAALNQELSNRLAQGAKEKVIETQNAIANHVDETKIEPVMSSRDARARVSELITAARRSGKLALDAEKRIVALQGQMNEKDLDASARQYKELLDSPNVELATP
jgi:hypothetical protein